MLDRKDVYKHLKLLLNILKKEKDILLSSDASELEGLIKEKTQLVEGLTPFLEGNYEHDANPLGEKFVNIVKEIKALQETNFLLTEQALSFQYVLMENIYKNINNSSTYSSKGNYQKSADNYIYDKEV